MADKNGKLTAWEIVNGNLLAMKMKDQVYIEVCDWELETIRTELQKYAKYKRAFEILKDTVDFNIFCREAKKGDGVEKTYFIIFGEIWIKINKEEYDLLKEVLGDEN